MKMPALNQTRLALLADPAGWAVWSGPARLFVTPDRALAQRRLTLYRAARRLQLQQRARWIEAHPQLAAHLLRSLTKDKTQ